MRVTQDFSVEPSLHQEELGHKGKAVTLSEVPMTLSEDTEFQQGLAPNTVTTITLTESPQGSRPSVTLRL